jgi:GxxExxY protein
MLIENQRINDITGQILACAIAVHRVLGPGLLESIYLECLMRELALRGIWFEPQRSVPVVYKGARLKAHYRIDLIVENLVVVEVKAVTTMLAVYEAQALTYLRLTGCPAALVVNFNVPRLIDGVRRLVNPRAGIEVTTAAQKTNHTKERRNEENGGTR